MVDCLDATRIKDYVAGSLPLESRHQADEHLARCEDCRAMVRGCRLSAELIPQMREVAYRDGTSATVTGFQSKTASTEPAPPIALDGFDIVGEIHRGGQGVVYEAMQHAPRRRVAIKFMLEGAFAGRADRARFEREVHVLGALKHPNIVAIHESGSSAGGFYFVMDYVEGQTLADLIATGPLPIPQALRLFQRICEAVHAAHLLGIIHRDLKPGNIRLDARGEPQILDFGLAKVGGDSSAVPGLADGLTHSGHFVGSLQWASPEQADGRSHELDAKTDVYSLGVVLFQMLTHRLPYALGGSLRESLNTIITAAPASPRALRREIDRDLETIVLKCLEKKREDRYADAGALAREIERYLAAEPIEARRASRWYVLAKTIRRHRVAVSVAGAFVLLIIGSSVWQTVLRNRAAREAEQRQTIAGVLNWGLGTADPYNEGKNASVLRLVEQISQRVEQGEFREQPDVQAALRETLANVFMNFCRLPEAERHLTEALSLRQSLQPVDDVVVSGLTSRMADLRYRQGRYPESETAYRNAISILSDRGLPPEILADARRGLASFLSETGRLAESSDAFLNLYHELSRMPDAPPPLIIIHDMAYVWVELGDWDSSEAWYRIVVDAVRKDAPEDDLDLAECENNLAMTLLRQNLPDEAIPLIERGLQVRQRKLGKDHPGVANSLCSLGFAHFVSGQMHEAEATYRQALELQQKAFGTTNHPAPAFTLAALAATLAEQGDDNQADQILKSSIDAYKTATGGSIHKLVPYCYHFTRAERRRLMGDLDDAERLYLQALEMYRQLDGDRTGHSPMALIGLAQTLAARKDYSRAEQHCREAIVLQRAALGGKHPAVASGLLVLGDILTDAGNPALAEAPYREAVQIRAELKPHSPWLGARARYRLGRSLALQGADEGKKIMMESYESLRATSESGDPRMTQIHDELTRRFRLIVPAPIAVVRGTEDAAPPRSVP